MLKHLSYIIIPACEPHRWGKEQTVIFLLLWIVAHIMHAEIREAGKITAEREIFTLIQNLYFLYEE